MGLTLVIITAVLTIIAFIAIVVAFLTLEIGIRWLFRWVAIRVFKVKKNPNSLPDGSTGELILSYGQGKKKVALFGFLVWCLIIALWFSFADTSFLFSLAACLMIGSFTGIPSLFMFVEFRNASCRIGQLGIQRNSPWTGKLYLLWSDVDAITYSKSIGWFVLKSGKGKIRLSIFLNGLKDFAVLVSQYVPEDKWASAKEQIEPLVSGKYPEYTF